MRPLTVIIALIFTALTVSGQDGADVDGDGIPDAWENGSVTVTLPSGKKMTIDLKSQGATSDHKDIFVWIDWMGDTTTPPAQVPHNHRPLTSALEIVRDAFAHAPIGNPDGTAGIRLHFIVSPEPVPHQDTLGNGTVNSVWNDFDKIKKRRFPPELEGIFHYCLFVHDILIDHELSISGYSRDIPAYDFLVSLGEWYGQAGSEDEQAGTLMHELGHNLGLHHGGLDDIRWKPNYISVMNYSFQTDGLVVPANVRRFDYSRWKLNDVDENGLDETTPLTGDQKLSALGTRYFCPSDPNHPEGPGRQPSKTIRSVTQAIDWNCDGRFDRAVKANISDNADLGLVKLNSYTDWATIVLCACPRRGGAPKSSGTNAGQELSLLQANTVSLPPVTGVKGAASNGSVNVTWDQLRSSRVVGYKITRTLSGQSLVFTTDQDSFADPEVPKGSSVHYDVQALYVPHGAPLVVKRTGEVENGEEVIAVGQSGRIAAPKKSLFDWKLYASLSEGVKSKVDSASGIDMTVTAAGRTAPRDRSNDVVLQTDAVAVEVPVP